MGKGEPLMGTAVKRTDMLTPGATAKALRTLELVIEGRVWKEIYALGGYDYRNFAHLLAKYPDLARSYQEARALSGSTFEDKALELAEKLAAPNEYTGTGVRALEVAMNQFRWSATKRDPRTYAEASASTGTMVPIQINTTLNLGQGGEQNLAEKTVWEVQAEVLAAGVPQPTVDLPPEAESEEDGDFYPEEENAAVDPLEAVRQKVHLPEEVVSAIPRRTSPGRPKKKHKTAVATGVTRGTYAKMKKSPSVRAALGIKDDDDGTA